MPDVTILPVSVTASVVAPTVSGSGNTTITISPVVATATVKAPTALVFGVTFPPLVVVTSVGFVNLSRGYKFDVYIDGVEVTNGILWEGWNITDSLGNIKGLYIQGKESINAAKGDEIILIDEIEGRRVFAGIIKEVMVRFLKKDYFIYNLICQDYTRIIDLVTSGVAMTQGDHTEYDIISHLISTYTPELTLAPNVLNPGETIVDIGWTNTSLREAIRVTAAENNRVWYVDFYKQFHYFALGDEVAPFGLSDSPDEVNTFKYGDLEYTEDTVNNELRGSFKVWKAGLYAGQTVGVTNAKLAWSAKEWLIYEVSARLIGGSYMFTDPKVEYTIAFGTRPKRVTERIPTEPVDEEEAAAESAMERTPFSVSGNWYAGTASSGETGADVVTINTSNTILRIYGLLASIFNMTATAIITGRLYQQVNGTERKIWEETITKGSDPDGWWVIDGLLATYEALRLEFQSNNAADTAKVVDGEYITQEAPAE